MSTTEQATERPMDIAGRPDLTTDNLRRILHLPPDAFVEHAPLPEGRFNWCWQVDTDAGRYLLKLNSDQGIRHLRRLARATRRAASAGVNVPAVERVGLDDQAGPYLVQRWLDGRTLSSWTTAETQVLDDPTIWTALGQQLGLLHRADLSGLRSPATLDRPARWRELNNMVRNARKAHILDNAQVGATMKRASDLLDTIADQSPAFCHLDIHPANILVTDNSSVALLDFDHARPADPVYDFVKIQMWCAPSADHFELVRNGYGATRNLQHGASFWPALTFYRLVNHVSYCLYWSSRDPRQVGDWVSALQEELEAS